MLGERRTAASCARPSISWRWAAENPVVPITARPRWRATVRRWARLASATENSMRMRSGPRTPSGSAVMGTFTRPMPATSPASFWRAGWPGASRAPTRRSPFSSFSRATRRLPMRPAAPAMTTSGMAVAGSALEQAVLREDGPEALPVGVPHPAEREAELGLEHAHHGHGLLHRDGVGLDEHGAAEREDPQVELPGEFPVPAERRMGHLRGFPRDDVGDHRDDPAAPHGHERQRQVVVTRHDREVGAAGED